MTTNEDSVTRLLDVGEALVSELDPDTVLEMILQEAQRLTGARYAALGVLDEGRTELERFVTAGIDEEGRRRIGELPRGRGVLGVLIAEPRPLRLEDVERHPESYGFPAGHPTMHSFLGVPIVIGGHGWGNLYLTEKEGGGGFTEEDEAAAVVLARWAAIAINNARIHRTSEQQRERLEYAMRASEAARDIADAIGSVADLDRVLELIVKRGRALVQARTLLIMLRHNDELIVAASAGHAAAARGQRIPIAGSTAGQVLERGRPQRISQVSSRLRIDPATFGVVDANTALLAPMLHRGAAIGVLAAFDHGREGDEFSDEDERLLRAFAASAANAVAIKRSVEADRLRATIAAAESERARWARDLHDETLQALGGLRVMLASTIGRPDITKRDETLRMAVQDIELAIAKLREIVSDLRPQLLDDLGLGPAIEALVERRRSDELKIESRLALDASQDGRRELPMEMETTIYRLVQESLTNVIKHAQARQVQVSVEPQGTELVVAVQDDGHGFDVDSRTGGFGLAGMQERVALAGGTLTVESGDSGTRVLARLPAGIGAEVIALRDEQAAS
ncbi:MAG: sensor histidine kinase [Solirubrobacteraceae bacterium]